MPALIEALNDAAEQYGVHLSAGDRVAVARALGALPVGTLNVRAVNEAVTKQGVRRTPAGFGTAVISRLRALGTTPTLQDVLLSYRQYAIDALSAEFGGRTRGREESLRNNLRTFITSHAHVEARTGRGKTDIYIPELDTLIEVKVWTDRSTYDEGVEELGRYIHTSRPTTAFMVVFGDRVPLPAIVGSHRDPLAETLRLEGLDVPVVVIPFEVDAPSKALRKGRARSRNGQ